MTTTKARKKPKTCRDCKLSYVKDDRNKSIACKYGDNYDFQLCQYTDIGYRCKYFTEPNAGLPL